jgi:hypothetical protein
VESGEVIGCRPEDGLHANFFLPYFFIIPLMVAPAKAAPTTMFKK